MKKVSILLILLFVSCGSSNTQSVQSTSSTSSTTTIEDANVQLKIAIYDDSVNSKYDFFKINIKKPTDFTYTPNLEFGADDILIPKMEVGEIGEFILIFDTIDNKIPICFSPTEKSIGDLATIFIVLNDSSIEVDGLAVQDIVITRTNKNIKQLDDTSFPDCTTKVASSSTSTTTSSSTTTSTTTTTTTTTIPPTPDPSTWKTISGSGSKFIDNIDIKSGLYIVEISGDDYTSLEVNGSFVGSSGVNGELTIQPVGNWGYRVGDIRYISVDAEAYNSNWKLVFKPVEAARNFTSKTISGSRDELIEAYFLQNKRVDLLFEFTSNSEYSSFYVFYYDCDGNGSPLTGISATGTSFSEIWWFEGVCFFEINVYGGTWKITNTEIEDTTTTTSTTSTTTTSTTSTTTTSTTSTTTTSTTSTTVPNSQIENPGDSKNCGDFSNYSEAKTWFDKYYDAYGDVARLDKDGDLIPCESLSGAP